MFRESLAYTCVMRTLIALALFTAVSLAADISGTWTAAVTLDAGSGTATFVLKQSGDQLTGNYSGALGEAKVTGTVKGDAVEWAFDHADAGHVKYSGTIKSPTKIEGTTEYGQLGKGTFVAEKK
jgi:hypothetical protein